MPNISSNESNQTIKFDQLTEHNTKNNFLETTYTNCGGNTIPKTFSKNQNRASLWINSLNFYAICFHCMSSWGLSKQKLSCKPRAFTSCKAFVKYKKRPGTSLPASISAWPLNWPNFIVRLPLLPVILSNVCIVIMCMYCVCVLFPRLRRHKFWNQTCLSSEAVFSI